jgi:TRAP-type C4-dicarboxylate transport system substrate-binding protein
MKRNTGYLKLFLALMLCFSVLTALTVSAGAADFKKEYKMQINVGPQFYWGMGAQKFADLVKERTGGQINI